MAEDEVGKGLFHQSEGLEDGFAVAFGMKALPGLQQAALFAETVVHTA